MEFKTKFSSKTYLLTYEFKKNLQEKISTK
jgi:hypothetical protein